MVALAQRRVNNGEDRAARRTLERNRATLERVGPPAGGTNLHSLAVSSAPTGKTSAGLAPVRSRPITIKASRHSFFQRRFGARTDEGQVSQQSAKCEAEHPKGHGVPERREAFFGDQGEEYR